MTKGKKTLFLVSLAAAALLALGLGLYLLTTSQFSIDLDRAQIQSEVQKRFPLRQQLLLLTVTLTNPRVELAEGSDRLALTTDVAMALPGGFTQTGSAVVSGAPAYDPAQGAFFLQAPRVEKLSAPALTPELQASARQAVDALASGYLARTPVYRLSSSETRYALTRLMLKSANVQNGKLHLVMSLH